MNTLHDFPFFPVEFAKDGSLFNPAQATALLEGLRATQSTDLLVISHGWNNDMAEARNLYGRFLGEVRGVLNDPQARLDFAARRLVVLGVLWPSKKFADAQLTPGAAAGLGSPISNAMLVAELERLKSTTDTSATDAQLKGTFAASDADARLAQAQQLVPQLENDPAARQQFVALLRGLLPDRDQIIEIDEAAKFRSLSGEQLFDRFKTPPPATALPPESLTNSADVAPAAGHAAGIGSSFFGGIKAAALNILNLTTYYQMKERAGLVGQGGANELLRRIRADQQLRALKIHLVGHSFGCRLLTAATAGADAATSVVVDSMTLLQGAFSHYGFSGKYDGKRDGFFRRVLSDRTVTGPIVVSHTRNDRAVGTMYPLASRLAGQAASAIGGPNDQYGGLGSNGAQKTPEATNGQLEAVGFAYAFGPGQVHNLKADTYIHGHSDICHPQAAYAFLKAVAAT
ncbi:hypothetical protein [Hymenobacter terrenus]|uniref:hypothetical protein n=1 Tax=Hymenobacter terrenus TaxID=1629124 RepID=UPI000619B829|nr:hypothetical protein [Hymenobacter terrenus]